MLIKKQVKNNDEKMIGITEQQTNMSVKEQWISRITAVVEVFGYLVVQLTLAGLIVYEVAGYVMYKINS